MERPVLGPGLDSKVFYEYYYLKEELILFCRQNGLATTGNKQVLTDRVACFLATGKKLVEKNMHKSVCLKDEITLEMQIEPDMVCSEKHRAFFRKQIGKAFTFNVAFQKWLKSHAGSTYGKAVEKWYEIRQENKPVEIGNQFKYNTYIHDFFHHNPGRTLKDAIRCWNYKKALPGKQRYEWEDIKILSGKEERK